jgi:endonuclease G, mitochondrial
MRPFLIGAAGGAALGGGAVYAYIQRRDESPASSKPATMESAESHPAMRMGWPTGTEDTLRVRSGFVASFDARTRNPRWVLEVINQDTVSGPGNRRRSDFVEDAETPASFRPKLSDYRGSGYDRGHLAAAAGHKDSQRAMDETFELINVSPQVGDGFNRDYWARLERFTRELSGKSGGDVRRDGAPVPPDKGARRG